jgi:hypothetical protein
VKIDEVTEFWFDWGDNQQLTVHEGLAMATNLLAAGPLPKQIGTRTSTYIALGPEVPPPWLSLFAAANDPASFQVETTLTARAPRGLLILWPRVSTANTCTPASSYNASSSLNHQMLEIPPLSSSLSLGETSATAWRSCKTSGFTRTWM